MPIVLFEHAAAFPAQRAKGWVDSVFEAPSRRGLSPKDLVTSYLAPGALDRSRDVAAQIAEVLKH